MNEREKYEKARATLDTVPTICTAYDCPYKNCENHIQEHIGHQGDGIFSALYSVCRKYIARVADNIPNGDTGKNY